MNTNEGMTQYQVMSLVTAHEGFMDQLTESMIESYKEDLYLLDNDEPLDEQQIAEAVEAYRHGHMLQHHIEMSILGLIDGAGGPVLGVEIAEVFDQSGAHYAVHLRTADEMADA